MARVDFSDARRKHLAWRTRLRAFLDGRATLTKDEAVSHRECSLGEWLYSVGMRDFGRLPEMQQLESDHEHMHGTVRRIVELVEAGDRVAAEREFGVIDHLSQAIVAHLNAVELKINSGGHGGLGRLLNLGITQKLALLGASVVLGFAVIGGVYWYGLGVQSDARAEDARVRSVDRDAQQMEILALRARRAEKDFLLRHDATYLNTHEKTMQQANRVIAELDGLVKSPEQKAVVGKIGVALRNYDERFGAMAAAMREVGLDEKAGLLGTLRNAVHDIEGVLKQHQRPSLTISMLMMRRHEKDFLARRAAKYAKELDDEAAHFRQLLAKADLDPPTKATISADLDTYQRDFKALVDGVGRAADETEKMRTAVHQLDPLLTELGKVNGRLAEENQQRQAAVRSRVTTVIGITLALTALVVFGLLALVVQAIRRPLAHAVEVTRELAGGNLAISVEVTRADEIGSLLTALKNLGEALRSVVTEVRQSADTLASASAEISAGNSDLSQRTEEQASSLEETASSMEELTSTVRQNADNAIEANRLAAGSSESAAQGGVAVGQVVHAMQEITTSSRKINDIISVVDEIAFQTNLLALNAAVEAARAGDQGRGFAVVAGEVRALAQRSAGAAKEIKALIGTSVGKVEEGTQLVDQAGTTLNQLIEGVRKVGELIAEISAASQEQSSGIDQVNKAITQMDEVTQQNAAMVEEMAASSRSLEEQAAALRELVGFFRVDET